MLKNVEVLLPLMEMVYHDDVGFTSFIGEFDEDQYHLLPNMYVVLVHDKEAGMSNISSSMLFKTSTTSHDEKLSKTIQNHLVKDERYEHASAENIGLKFFRVKVECGGIMNRLEMEEALLNFRLENLKGKTIN